MDDAGPMRRPKRFEDLACQLDTALRRGRTFEPFAERFTFD